VFHNVDNLNRASAQRLAGSITTATAGTGVVATLEHTHQIAA
jgi:hypothetical protein